MYSYFLIKKILLKLKKKIIILIIFFKLIKLKITFYFISFLCKLINKSIFFLKKKYKNTSENHN